MMLVLVLLGAAIGAPARYLADRFVQARHDSVFPWGTFAVNVVGSFILGVVVGSDLSSALNALLATGFCGALTTYSTFGYETVRLLESNRPVQALANVVSSVALGLTAAFCGAAIAG